MSDDRIAQLFERVERHADMLNDHHVKISQVESKVGADMMAASHLVQRCVELFEKLEDRIAGMERKLTKKRKVRK